MTPQSDITLTPEEAALAAKALREYGLKHYGDTHTSLPYGVLADRLESATAADRPKSFLDDDDWRVM